jgi:HD-GYP domain-containing protein (c-di-GMP phosphodiesterase class II)/HAMP domain-containing protein
MAAESYWIKLGMLRSKVARRMFLVFVGCALVPLIVLALVSFLNVRSQMNSLSERRLHQTSKSAGMTVIERVSFLETDLHLLSISLPSNTGESLGPLVRDLGARLGGRFVSLAVLDSSDRLVSSLSGLRTAYPRLTSAQRAHLRSGAALVTTAPNGDGTHAVFVARLLGAPAPDGHVLIGEASPDHLWGGSGLVAPETAMCVLTEAGETLFTSLPGGVPARQLKDALKTSVQGRFEWSHNSERYVAAYWTIFMLPEYRVSWVLVESERQSDVGQPLRDFGWAFFLILLSTFWVVTFATLSQIRRRTTPIEQLLDATHRLKAKDFSHRIAITSDDEFAELGVAFNDMTESMESHLTVMHTINGIGVSLTAEKNEARLLETMVDGTQAAFNADGAALFLLSKDGRLGLALANLRSLSLRQRGPAPAGPHGSEHTQHGDIPVFPAVDIATERTIATSDVYGETHDDFAPLVDFDRRTGYRSQSFIGVPLRNHENEVIGILQLVNAQSRRTGGIVPFSEDDQRLAESLASQAAVALTKNRLVEDFKGLFEGMTDLISTAIDDQSPHTGGHVRRVVVLSEMIAEAMSRSPSRAIRDRALSPDELYELRIAALMHDCGKLTTPVHLTDKRTKLQGIFDRMRLVEARAETVRRQQRIELLEEAFRRLAGNDDGDPLAAIDAAAACLGRQIEEDLAAVRSCNSASEHTSDDLRNRMRAIGARYSWTNINGETETLLSDDEMHHLDTTRGTLTAEERHVMQGHVVSTIRMLERLPYPKSLRNVPKYAGAHHEQLCGKGYPLKLSGEEIPIQGRIIGIADVLEALTARDRPYRRAMSLSEAMSVLENMVRAGAIDPDLYDLVVAEHIHERYAEQCLHS